MKAPCKECPFKRRSAPGWIGPYKDPSEITDIVLADQRFPCHMKMLALAEAGATERVAVAEADLCVGAVVFLSNQLKLSRNPEIAAAQRKLHKRPDVFAHAHEMEHYHRKRPRRLVAIAAWINKHLSGHRASTQPWSVSTDYKPPGFRYITRKGKGRKGTRLTVYCRGKLVYDFNNAETYRCNEEVERWLNEYITKRPGP